MDSRCNGGYIANNTIGNTVGGGGLMQHGIRIDNSPSITLFKYMLLNNNFMGLAYNNQYNGFLTAAPTNGIYDAASGDVFLNTETDAGEAPGWQCVKTTNQVLTANASNAIGTTVTVGDTTGILAGDIILLTKTNNPYGTGYYTFADWHVTTVASVTNGSQFVLTGAIAAMDGAYVSGTAYCKTARFKAHAAIGA